MWTETTHTQHTEHILHEYMNRVEVSLCFDEYLQLHLECRSMEWSVLYFLTYYIYTRNILIIFNDGYDTK